MTFKSWFSEISRRNGPAYGAGPAGFARLMKRLGNPQNSYSIIHVAGTNGKGSICYLTASVLQAAGYKSGLFISPHLYCPTERISVNGQQISKVSLQRLTEQVLAQEQEKLNFFEILTAVAFLYFAQKKVNYVVLETGLGGRKDPTNICHPSACVISSIGLDHCKILGDTLAKIAHEKAGIIKRGVPVFCPLFPPEVMRKIRTAAEKKRAALHIVKQGEPFKLAGINWKTSDTILRNGTVRWRLHLLGEKQVQNACLVYHVCCALGVPENMIKKGFARVQIPARFEIVRRGKKTIILDGAHNPQAVENLVRFFAQSPWKGKAGLVCGFMADKDYPAMLRILAKQFSQIYATCPDSSRAATLSQVEAALPGLAQVSYFNRPADAIQAAIKRHSTVVVTGSFYLAGKLRACLYSSRVRMRATRKD